MEPGASVGIICSQSLSQPITQTALSLFHQIGRSENEPGEHLRELKQGVPRVEAIVDQTIKLEESSNSFLFVPFNDTVHEILDLTINDLTEEYFLMEHTEEECWWYSAGVSSGFYTIDPFFLLSYSNIILRIRFDVVRMEKYQLSLFDLMVILNEQITGNDIHFFLSPQHEGIIDVILSHRSGSLPTKKLLLKIFIKVISPCHVFPTSHVKGIKDFFIHDGWCRTKGTNTVGLLQSDNETIDKNTLRTDNPKDMMQALGIEAARKILVEELSKAMFGSIKYDDKHINLLADFMTSKGNISSIKSISELANDRSVLTRASNERSIQLLKEACMKGMSSKIVGVSESIIVGQTANIGTGFFYIKDG